MFKVILWDLDNTLLDFNAAERHSLKAQFARFGLGECTDEMVARYSEINNHYWRLLEKGEVTKQQTLQGRFETFFSKEGITADVEAFNKAYETGLTETIAYIENSYDIVASLKGKVEQYAVTNGAYEVQRVKLEKSGFGELFDGAFISDKVGFEKPSIAFFNYVLERIKPFEKSEILIIGDSLTSDMIGGNNAGIQTCWYNPHGVTNDRGVHIDYEIRHLDEIFNILK